jgi:hypothetical protein
MEERQDYRNGTYSCDICFLMLGSVLLRVEFVNGAVKRYDCGKLIEEKAFAQLCNSSFFKNVRVDASGYGIVWNDDLDLSESELWIHGTVIE